MVRRALDRCQLMVGHNPELAERFDTVSLPEKVGLLYPRDDARLLTELTPQECPEQLIVLDGTWHHVKTLMRDVPRLRTLTCYRLAPTSPGRYRIRREPHAHALSTLEATVAALSLMEPETDGLDRLLSAFDRMIAEQLQHGQSNWRRNEQRRRGMPNVPRILTGDLSDIVVAYGERERGRRSGGKEVGGREVGQRKPAPIYWTAVRMVSGERFQAAIETESLRDAEFLRLLRLPPEVTQAAVSVSSFRAAWQDFLRPGDHVAVYHSSTAKLLANVDAQFAPTVILKSINVEPDSEAIDQLPGALQAGPHLNENSRASERLASAVAFVEYLNRRFQSREPKQAGSALR